QDELNIENKLRKDGITLTADQSAAIQNYLDHIQQQNEKLQEMKELGDGIGEAFDNAFQSAIQGGQKLSDVMKQLGLDLINVFEKVLIMEPIENNLKSALGGSFNSSSGSGGIGSIFSSLFNNLPSFDVGTDYDPHDMLALIHQGEKITPAHLNKPG